MNDISVIEPDVEVQIHPDATFDDWKQMGHLLTKGTEGLCWAWGKWWELGHQKWNREAVEFVDNELPLTRGTLHQYGRVWKTFPESGTRVPLLSFKHHRTVVAMHSDEKKMRTWLQKAVDNEWSADRLRAEIQGKPQEKKSYTATGKRLTPIKDTIAEILKLLDVSPKTLIPQTVILAKLRNIQKQLDLFK